MDSPVPQILHSSLSAADSVISSDLRSPVPMMMDADSILSKRKSAASPSVNEWSEMDVAKWLRSINLDQYVEKFVDNHIDGSTLLQLDKSDVLQLGVQSVGHRARLTLEINDLRKNQGLNPLSSVKKIAIEGNIAAGKSTFLNILGQNIDFVVVQEPVSKWQNITSSTDEQSSSQVSGGNLLQMFYDDPARWGYTFQTYAFLSRMRAQMQPVHYFDASLDGPQSSPMRKRRKQRTTPLVQFFERSVYSDRYCFAMNCAESGIFNDVEWNTYCDWHTWLMETFSSLRLDGIVYLRTKPETCFERLKRRARDEEKTVSLEYLQSIHDKHERWLTREEHNDSVATEIKSVPKIVIESDLEFEKEPVRCKAMLDMVNTFVASL